jgi:hypothetical protein
VLAATGALLGVALTRPALTGAQSATPAAGVAEPFDPVHARRLQEALDAAVAAANEVIPGAILHVERAGYSHWTGATGLRQLDPDVPMRPDDRFGAGSIVKPFVATTETEAYQKAMRKRKVWIEPLFAEAKDWHGLRRLRLRGLENANIQGLLIATGQNL